MSKPIVKHVLDAVVVFSLEPHIWSGRSKLRKEDLVNIPKEDLPPDTLASLGSKRKIDTEHLNIFEALKKRAERACKAVGVRFLAGYAVPVSKAQKLADDLDKIEAEFNREKANFIANYGNYVKDWMEKHKEWAHTLKSVVTPVEYVDAATSFSWQCIQVAEPKGRQAEALKRGLGKEVTGLADRLFEEVASEAEEMLEKSLHGRDKVTQKALNRVQVLRDKLHDLSFLNANVMPLVQSIDHTLSLLPKTGHIEGIGFQALYGLLSLLSDPDRAKAHGASINNGTSVEDAVSASVLGQSAATVVAAAAASASAGTPAVAQVAAPVVATADVVAQAPEAPPVLATLPAPASNEQPPVPPAQPPIRKEKEVETGPVACIF